MDLWKVPDVLIIHLKRFQYIPGQYFVHRDKISDNVIFPVEGLDLTGYVKGPSGMYTTPALLAHQVFPCFSLSSPPPFSLILSFYTGSCYGFYDL